MKKLLRALSASMVMLALFSATAFALVEVEAEIQDVREIGTCHPYADTIEGLDHCGFMEVTLPIQHPTDTYLSCIAGPDGQMGTPDDVCVHLPLMLPNPNGEGDTAVYDKTVTSFRFNDSSHEVVGTLRFSAINGGEHIIASSTLGRGVNDVCETFNDSNGAVAPGYVARWESGSYDFDVPDRLFSCSDNPLNAHAIATASCPIDNTLIPAAPNCALCNDGCCDLNGLQEGGVNPFIYNLNTAYSLGSCPNEPYPLYDTGACAEKICIVAPDVTGRLDSKSCSNYFNPSLAGVPDAAPPAWGSATYACKLNPSDAEVSGFTFFNYLACTPDISCFDTDPIHNVGCDNGGDGPFGGVFPAPNDIWIAGTIMGMRLPFGVRLANTLYPGVMLNGQGQFDHSDNSMSMRMWPLNVSSVYTPGVVGPGLEDVDGYAWPAVVFDFEANHWLIKKPDTVPSDEVCDNVPQQQGPCCGWDGGGSADYDPLTGMEFPNSNWQPKWGQDGKFTDSKPYEFGPRCKARFGDFDRIKIFVPDILDEMATAESSPSSFQIGEALINQGGLIPSDRNEVENCYNDVALDTCSHYPQTINNRCDYDTSICVDLRGAVPAMRHDSVFSYARHVSFDLELPNASFTDFSDQQPTVAVVTPADPTNIWDPFTSSPLSYPNCDGFNFCFVVQPDDDDTAGELLEFPGTEQDDPGYILIDPSYVSTIRIRETTDGFIRVDPSAGLTTISCVIPDDDSNGNDLASVVDFVTVDCTNPLSNNLNGGWTIHEGTKWERDDCCLIGPPAPIGFGVGLEGSLDAGITDGEGMDVEMYWYDQSYDEIVVTVTQESSDAAEITISGIQLLVEEDNEIFPGGNGCIEVDCTLYFPGDQCKNHEGTMTNGDSDGDPHFPDGGGSFTTTGLQISCIVPGRTVLLFPYLVRMLDADVNIWHDSGVAIVNTMPAWALTHFYLYEEGPAEDGFIRDEAWNMNSMYHNEATNPPVDLLKQADPELLIRGTSPEYVWYNEISPLGQYVNMIFEVENDPYTGVPLNSILAAGDVEGDNCRHSSGIFPYEVLQSLSSDPDCNPLSVGGRVWMYAVVQQCYSHGYQIVFSDYGFGSTLALVDQEVEMTPINDQGNIVYRSGAKGAVDSAVAFIPVHTPPARFIETGVDTEVRRYDFWNGNEE